MERRNFLRGMAGIFAAAAAPAIIHNAMKIKVPSPKVWTFTELDSYSEFEPLENRTVTMIEPDLPPGIKAYIDYFSQQPIEHRRRGQVIDTSRGLYTYRVPLQASKDNRVVVVPYEERVLRFS